jgi:hypothetical protein
LRAAQITRDGLRAEWQIGERTMREVLDADQDVLAALINIAAVERDRVVTSYAVVQSMGRLSLTEIEALDLNASKDGEFRTAELAAKTADAVAGAPAAKGPTYHMRGAISK